MLREDLFDKVYESLYPILFRISFRITGSRTKAEDLCHEAFIKYLQREEPLPDIEQTKYWLIRVLKNISLNYEKKRAREKRAYGRLQKNAPQYSKVIIQQGKNANSNFSYYQSPYNKQMKVTPYEWGLFFLK